MASRRASPLSVWLLPVVLSLVLPAVLLAVSGTLLTAVAARATDAPSRTIEVAQLNGEINAITASYLDGAVQQAETDHDSALIVVTDTPGGLSDSMDDISEHFLNSSVPVVVFVSPTGARDDSAGLFISQAADVIAMAPGTNIGSAHPVLLSTTGGSAPSSNDPEQAKVLNDAVARVRNFAAIHHRNADWAEQAVRQSVNISAEEAVRLHVADLEANDLASLLRVLDGRTVQRLHGPAVLTTAGATLSRYDMPWLQSVLHDIISPDIAYLLFLVALVGIATELTHPGVILPGVAGVLAGVLALVALYGLSVNLAGIVLVLFGIGLFVADLKAQSHGVLTIGGLLALVAGSTFLFNTNVYGPGLDLWVIALVTAAAFGFFVLVLRKVVAARLRPAYSGSEALVGSVGSARETLDPQGLVFVDGALWKGVTTESPIAAGTPVRVVARDGLTLQVAAAAADKED
jgi:membrane-bound serine protease (ClpP class)